MKKRIIILVVVLVMAIPVIACSQPKAGSLATQNETVDQNGQNATDELSAWAIYWDTENGKSELLKAKNINEISFFAAYFNDANELILPEKIETLHKAIEADQNRAKTTDYLTIVNDKVMADGKSSLKDQSLLETLLENEDTRNRHIDKIIEMAKSNGYDGVEIDYEKIRNNLDLWALFLEFSTELSARCETEGLKLRIVLEPSTPIEKLEFPKGPEYVMMCYNLYGSASSGPGPKADYAFLKELINKMKALPGKKSFALATGGFDWTSDGKVTALTEKQAQDLLAASGVNAQRDDNSGSLNFTFSDQNDVQHQVWFADATTISSWMETIQAAGDDGISIWRLGGNQTLDTIL